MKPLSALLLAPVMRTLAAAPLLLSAATSWAHVTFGVHIGIPGAVYVAPPPAYVVPPPVWVMPRVILPGAGYVAPVVPIMPYHRAVPYRALVNPHARPFSSRSGYGAVQGRHAPRHQGGGRSSGYGGYRHR